MDTMVIRVLCIIIMYNISICTVNVNGLRDSVKRRQTLASCSSENSDILLLQETHASGFRDTRGWEREFDGKGFWSFGTRSSCGVAILFSKRHSWRPTDYLRDNAGRLVSVTITMPHSKARVRVVNCYAPNDPAERKRFFKEILPQHTKGMRHVIIGGDFNCVSDPGLDSKNAAANHQGTRGSPELLRTVKQLGLVDVWRVQHPTLKRFTWHSGDGTRATRIDRIYLSRELSVGSNSEITAFPLSDHDMVTTKIRHTIQKAGRGFWRCNTQYLENDSFKEVIANTWANWVTQKNNFDNILDWWDEGKNNIKRAVISFSADASRKRNSEYKEALREVNLLRTRVDGGEDQFLPELQAAAQNLQEKAKKQHGSSPRPGLSSKIMGEDNAQQPNAKDPDSKRMQALKDRDGRVTDDPVQMTDICRRFYGALYAAAPVEQSEIDFFLGSIDESLGHEELQLLEGPVTLAEVGAALSSMEAGKSPGSDGLPAEFYRTFFNEIGQDICEVLDSIFQQGGMSASQKTGLITLLFKERGEREDLSNWRPISLLNVDYKIITKILATRLRRVLHKIVSPDQTCSVAGRTILDNAHLLRNIQDYVDQKSMGAAFVSLDQQKAFDRVDWGYLQQVLEKFGFGPNFRKWVKIAYTDIKSSVICNGHISEPFSLSRGVRQGCPLSPLLYILALEPLGCALRADPNITGVKLPGGTEARVSMYADDTTLILSDDRSVTESFRVIERYERASGAKLNQQKSHGVYLGKWRGRLDGPVDIAWVNSAKIIGIHFGYGDPHQQNWRGKISQIARALEEWGDCDLTMLGRVTVANTHILSKIWYLAEIDPPQKREIKQINRLIFRFIWGHNGEFVARATMFLPPSRGGLGVINIEDRVAAMQGIHVSKTVSNETAKWKALARYWCAISLRAIAPALLRNNTPLCSAAPEFYKSVLKNFKENKHLVADWRKNNLKAYLAAILESRKTEPKVERDCPDKRWPAAWKNTLCAKKLKNSQISLNFKIAHNVLPTGYRLRRSSHDNGDCPHCGRMETLQHVFLDCSVVRPVRAWLSDYLGSLNNRPVHVDSDTMILSLFETQIQQKPLQQMTRVISLYRMSVWLARNKAKFENKKAGPTALIETIKSHI